MNSNPLILYQDRDILVANKPSCISSIPDKTGTISLLELLVERDKDSVLFPIHRIDKPVSGVILYAKNRQAADFYSKLIVSKKIQKEYLAFTKKLDSSKEIELTDYIKRDPRARKAILSKEEKEGFKKAILRFKVILQSENYSLLRIRISTGRFHQIRVQLSHFGIPIKGDVKYGAKRKNKDRSIHLHAYKLSIPLAGEKEARIFTAPLPEDSLWDLAKNTLHGSRE